MLRSWRLRLLVFFVRMWRRFWWRHLNLPLRVSWNVLLRLCRSSFWPWLYQPFYIPRCPSPEVRSIHNSHEYSPTGMANSLPTPPPARTDIRFDGAGNLSDSSRPLLPGERYFGSERYSADRVDTVHDRFFKDFRESLLPFPKAVISWLEGWQTGPIPRVFSDERKRRSTEAIALFVLITPDQM